MLQGIVEPIKTYSFVKNMSLKNVLTIDKHITPHKWITSNVKNKWLSITPSIYTTWKIYLRPFNDFYRLISYIFDVFVAC